VRHLAPALVLCACAGAPAVDPVVWHDFAAPELTGLHTTFRHQAAFEPTDAQRTDVVARCPVVRQASAVKETGSFYLVTLRGDRLDSARVGAVLPDGTLADAEVHAIEGGIQLPVRCESCRLFPAVKLEDGRSVGCVGPGYSVSLNDGVPSSP